MTTSSDPRAPRSYASLADYVERLGDSIARRAMAIMYANPFWDDRFGARGRRFAEEDGRRHIAYLCEALRQGSSDSLVHYTRWVQSVLTTRGMCSAHLDENLERVGGIILSEELPDGHVAVAFLDAGRRALCYAPGPARDIQDASDAIGVEVRRTLSSANPRWRDEWGRDSASRLTATVEWPVSYLADAVHLGRDDQLAGYLAWLADFAARREIPATSLESFLLALGSALDHLAGETRRFATETLARARALAATIQSPAAR
ncbi:MAG: hypothetical protein HOQ09_08040 [Gemmatimonadaceae bacterium]|nr:hypothetical protein [Gemmatimonadaceae bacterium]